MANDPQTTRIVGETHISNGEEHSDSGSNHTARRVLTRYLRACESGCTCGGSCGGCQGGCESGTCDLDVETIPVVAFRVADRYQERALIGGPLRPLRSVAEPRYRHS